MTTGPSCIDTSFRVRLTHKNIAEEPKFNQAILKPFTKHWNTRTNPTDEEWWRDRVKRINISRDMTVCIFGAHHWHTKQCRRSQMQPKRPIQTHKNTCKDRTNEEWWRDGEKRTNRSQDMTVCVFGAPLTHDPVQKVQNSSKMSHPKAVYNG